MNDIYQGFRNADGSLSYQGAHNAGANEANKGWQSSPQQYGETAREHEIRQQGYNSTNR